VPKIFTKSLSPRAALRTSGIRCVSGSWSSPNRPLAPATLKCRRLVAEIPWALAKNPINRSTVGLEPP
jgi:ribosome biogenesis protein Tsr3